MHCQTQTAILVPKTQVETPLLDELERILQHVTQWSITVSATRSQINHSQCPPNSLVIASSVNECTALKINELHCRLQCVISIYWNYKASLQNIWERLNTISKAPTYFHLNPYFYICHHRLFCLLPDQPLLAVCY